MARVLCKYFIIATLNFYYNSYPPTEFPDWCFFLGPNILYCVLALYLQEAIYQMPLKTNNAVGETW